LGAPERVVDDHAAIAWGYRRVWDRGSIAAEVDALRVRVDAHFDRLAELAAAAGSSAEAPPRAIASRLDDERERYARAARSLGPRMAAQQAAFADRQRDMETMIARQADDALRRDAALKAAGEQISRFREEVSWLHGIVAERDAELTRLRPLLKYSPPWIARRIVGRARRTFRRGP
jgi:hypothetical protein